MRIAVITSRSARDLIESIAGGAADVIALPVHAISFLNAETIARIIERNPSLKSALKGYDVILVPGTVRGDTSTISRVVGVRVFKASRSPSLLPKVIEYLSQGGSLDSSRSAEELVSIRPDEEEVNEAFSLGGVPIPSKGPPMILASEVPPETPLESVGGEAKRMVGEGARIIIVGCSFDDTHENLEARIKMALEAGAPVIAEAPTPSHAEAALAAGASALSLGADRIDEYLDLIASRGAGVVLGERSLESISRAVGLLESRGARRIIVDPVLGVPLIDLADSISRYREASRLGYPILFSSANVIEEIEADSHSMHALLAALALELGASIYVAVEASYKSLHSTAEAREALRLVHEAWKLRITPRGIPSRLLVLKQAEPPREPPVQGGEVVGYIEPRWDKRGYILVFVDHERGLVGATYKLYSGGEITVAGRHPQSVARALVRKAGLDPEHAAYLGFELSKAYISLKLGKSYIQDYDVIEPPWVFGDEG